MKRKLYILIGGNGFIGSYIRKFLKNSNINNTNTSNSLIVIDNKVNKVSDIFNNENEIFIKDNFENVIDKVLQIVKEKLDSYEGTLIDTIEIHHLAAIVGVNSVINDNSYFEQEMKLNYAVFNFIKELKNMNKNMNKDTNKNKNINFIYYSSSEVYGNKPYQLEIKPTELQTIEDKNFKRNRYNALKSFGEYLFNDLDNSEDKNFNYLVIRPYNVIGIGQRDEFILPKMVKDAFYNKKIKIYGNGLQSRTFIYVEDFVNIVLNAVELVKPHNFKILNISNISNFSTIKNFANIIKDKVSFILKEIVDIEYEDNDILIGQEKRIPDIERQYNILKLKPQKKLEKIIEEYIDWFIKD